MEPPGDPEAPPKAKGPSKTPAKSPPKPPAKPADPPAEDKAKDAAKGDCLVPEDPAEDAKEETKAKAGAKAEKHASGEGRASDKEEGKKEEGKKEEGKKEGEKKESESEDEDQDEILEESPCGRWQKRREQVRQRDVPGIDAAHLAMDTETGNEVVWNEVQFSERKNFRSQEEKIRAIFDNVTLMDHCNLVKFYKWWTDERRPAKPRVIFITEYMSSGNMSQFLKRTRKGTKVMSEKSWKKWSTQILSALSYLHSSQPPIIHGNLSCNTIFIQQNGLIKIGCVAPNAIHHHVKTFRDSLKALHYAAPEYETSEAITEKADIYAFGVCVLEMAVLGFTNGDPAQAPKPTPEPKDGAATTPGPVTPGPPPSNSAPSGLSSLPLSAAAASAAAAPGSAGPASGTPGAAAGAGGAPPKEEVVTPKVPPLVVTREYLLKKLSMLDECPRQKDFIALCLEEDPEKRPSARELLFHDVLFEVHSLKLLAAHAIVNGKKRYERGESTQGGDEEKKRSQYLQISEVSESFLEDHIRAMSESEDKERVVAEIRFRHQAEPSQIRYSQLPLLELDKFLEDVKNGIYPLTAFASTVQTSGLPATMPASSRTLPVGLEKIGEEGESGPESGRRAEAGGGLEGRKDSMSHRLNRQPSGASKAGGSSDAGDGEVSEASEGGEAAEPKDPVQPPATPAPAQTPSAKEGAEKPLEDRRVLAATAEFVLDPTPAKPIAGRIRIRLKLDDQMNRELSGDVGEADSVLNLTRELVDFGLINADDAELVLGVLRRALENPTAPPKAAPPPLAPAEALQAAAAAVSAANLAQCLAQPLPSTPTSATPATPNPLAPNPAPGPRPTTPQ